MTSLQPERKRPVKDMIDASATLGYGTGSGFYSAASTRRTDVLPIPNRLAISE